MFFAATFEEMKLSAVLDPCAAIATSNDGSAESDSESSEEEKKQDNEATKIKLTDQQEFPLLHSLSLCTEKHMDRLVHEVLKFHGNKTVKVKQMNNHEGMLLLMPFATNLKWYEIELAKSGYCE